MRVSGPRGGLYIVCQGLLDGRLLDGHLGAYYILMSFFLNIQEFKNQFSNINTGGYDINYMNNILVAPLARESPL